MTIVLHRHLRELGYCNRGSREWFARHGLDWAEFIERGIEAEKLTATNDAMATKLVEHSERARSVEK
jgi:hypothetical protein